MKLGIMQPYFLPYIGYWQLINVVDKFIVYDNVEFSRRGWFHRNQILMNEKPKLFSLPIKNDSDYLNVNQRFLANNFRLEMNKVLGQVKSSYIKAPFFYEVYPIIEKCFHYKSQNLFDFIFYSIKEVTNFLNIKTEILISSETTIDHNLKGKERVFAFCEHFDTRTYINSIGGKKLYAKESFKKKNIDLKFLQVNTIQYKQFSKEFVPFLSILDIMMFNSVEDIAILLNEYTFE